MQSNLMNVILLCKNNTPELAAKLVNCSPVAEATAIVACVPEMLTNHEFTQFKRCLIEETKIKIGKNKILTDGEALGMVEYANRRGGMPEEKQTSA